MANIYDLADTWSDAGTTYTAIKMDVTNTASASGSLLMDLQVGGTSYFNVAKSGVVNLNSQGFVVSTTTTAGAATRRLVASNGLYNISTNSIYWSDNTTDVVPIDLQIGRKGERNLRLGPADAAALQNSAGQTLSVQSIADGTTANAVGGDFTIEGSQGTGTGDGGSIIFKVAPAGSSGSTQNALATALTIGSSGSLSSAYGINLGQPSGTAGTGQIFFYSGISSATALAMQNANGVFRVSDSGSFQFHSGANVLSGSPDVILARDAANTLALRNSTNAQTFRVYNTHDGTDNSWFECAFAGGNAYLRTQKVGGATDQNINILPSGALLGLGAANTVSWYATSSAFAAAANNSTIIFGATSDVAIERSASGILQITDNSTGGGSLELLEQTAPAAGGATSARIFAQDNGSGKTQLMVQFGSGAAQQIAIEP